MLQVKTRPVMRLELGHRNDEIGPEQFHRQRNLAHSGEPAFQRHHLHVIVVQIDEANPLVAQPISQTGRGEEVLENIDAGLLLADRVEGAFDSQTRRRGLLGRRGLDGRALVIAPCSLVHTCFMQFIIDIVFVDQHGRVVRVRHGVRPWHVAGAWRALATIELEAGKAERAGVRQGHCLVLTRAA